MGKKDGGETESTPTTCRESGFCAKAGKQTNAARKVKSNRIVIIVRLHLCLPRLDGRNGFSG